MPSVKNKSEIEQSIELAIRLEQIGKTVEEAIDYIEKILR